MIPISSASQAAYVSGSEPYWEPPKVTPYEEIPRDKAKELLIPGDPWDLNSESNGQYQYDPDHKTPRDDKHGWTERSYVGIDTAGGMVRNALLSGSYGELKKLRVDSEVNSETVTTSWSASIGENLRVGNNAGVAGYLNIGDTASLVTGSDQPGRDPEHVFAPNAENVSDLRLIVSDSALIKEDLYVKDSASVSGGLDVKGDTRLASNLYVTGTAEVTTSLKVVGRSYLTGNVQIVGNEAITGSLHVSKSIYGSENLYLTGNAEITGNVSVVGNEAVTGSLHVSKSIYGSENMNLTGNLYVGHDAVVSQSLFVNGDTDITGNLTVHQSESVLGDVTIGKDLKVGGTASLDKTLVVYGKTTIEDDLLVNGNAEVTGNFTIHGDERLEGDLEVLGDITGSRNLLIKSNSLFEGNVVIQKDLIVNGTASYMNIDDLYVKDKSITVASGAINPEAANGAGFDIDGADVHFHYTSSTDRMGLNKGLDILGDENVTGSLKVTGNEIIEQNLYVSGNTNITGNLGVRGNVDIESNHFSMSNASIVDGVANITREVNTTNVSASGYVSASALYVDKSASINEAYITQSYVGNEVVTQSLVLTQSVSHSTVLSQSVQTQSVLTQSVNRQTVVSSSVENVRVGGDGERSSVVVETGSIEARDSDLFIHNITGSGNMYMNGIISGTFYGDGRGLIGLTASAASSSTWKSYLDFEAGATQRLTHPFNTTDVFVQVYRWDDPNFHPSLESGSSFSSPATRINDATVKIIGNGLVDISYGEAVNGYAVISDAGMIISGNVDLLQVAAETASYNVQSGEEYNIFRFSHKLGTENLIVQVYQNVDNGYGVTVPVQILPEQISIPDKSHIDVVFGRPANGYIVLGKAGHVIKQFDMDDALVRYNIHFGTTGNWAANSFTAETMSGDTVKAGEFVDTCKIGNRDVGFQYYADRAWGSYTEYTDTGINEYVRYSAEAEEDVWQVSNIDSVGNLTIRGSLITNGSFSTSDIRRKHDIVELNNALDSLKKLRGVRFKWNGSGEESIGVVAQEVQSIYPELTKVATDLDGQELMTVNYDGLVGVLIQAVKDLSKRVDQLEQQIQSNENR